MLSESESIEIVGKINGLEESLKRRVHGLYDIIAAFFLAALATGVGYAHTTFGLKHPYTVAGIFLATIVFALAVRVSRGAFGSRESIARSVPTWKQSAVLGVLLGLVAVGGTTGGRLFLSEGLGVGSGLLVIVGLGGLLAELLARPYLPSDADDKLLRLATYGLFLLFGVVIFISNNWSYSFDAGIGSAVTISFVTAIRGVIRIARG